LERSEFGPFTIDHRAFELRRNGQRVRISASLLKLLVLFVERPGELITRDQIIACLWDQPESVDVDTGINTALSRLRLILRDHSGKRVYLETVVGAGYRFKMPVKRFPETTVADRPVELLHALPAMLTAPPLLPPARAAEIHGAWSGAGKASAIPSSESFAGAQAIASQATGGRGRIRRLLPLAAFALLAAAFLVAWRLHPGKQVGAETRNTAALFSEATFNDEGDPVTTQAISHNGDLLAYSDSRGLFSRDLRSAVVTSLSMPAGLQAKRLTWQADDRALLVSGLREQNNGSVAEVWLVPRAAGQGRLLVQGGSDAVASPDGMQLAYIAAHGTELWASRATGASPHRLRTADPAYALRSLEWAPTSDRLIVDNCKEPSLTDPTVDMQGNHVGRCTYESIDAASGAILASQPETYFDSAFFTADDRLYFSRDVLTEESSRAGLFMVMTDRLTGRFLTAPHLVLRLPGDHVSGISASSGGHVISALVRRRSSDVFVGDLSLPGPALSHIQQLHHMAPDNYPHAWSPDSKQVIFESNDTGDYAIYQQGLDGSAAHLLARAPENGALPRLSPDHRSVFFENFTLNPGLVPQAIFQAPLTGGEIRQLPLRGTIEDFDCPSVYGSRENVDCVVRERTGNDVSFFRFDPIKGEGPVLVKVPATPPVLGNWSLSCDGTEVAIPGNEPSRSEIQLVSLSGKQPAVQTLPIHLVNPGALVSVIYSPRGDGFYAQVRTGTGYDLGFIDRSGKMSVLRQVAVPTWGIPSPDGKKLAFVDQAASTNAWVGTGIASSANLEQPIRTVAIGSILDHSGK
jgi:DNA-binding winged helix-turn-helix (wHTH) protein